MRVPPQNAKNIIKMYIVEGQDLDNKRATLYLANNNRLKGDLNS